MIQVLYCPQSRMLKGALRKILKDTLPHLDDLNYVSLDMGTTSLLELASECSSLPLGYDKKTVVAENFFYLEKSRTKVKTLKGDSPDDLLRAFEKPEESIDLFLLVYSDSLDERSPFYKSLLAGGAKFSPVGEFSPQQWKDYIERFFAKRGVTIEAPAIAELSFRIQGDYARFLSEGPKLLAYSNGEKITKEDIEKLVSEPLEDDAFHLSNALAKGDVAGAIKIYHDLQNSAAEPITLIRLLANQFRFLNEVLYLKNRGLSASEIANQLQASPYRVSISLDNLRKMNDGILNEILENLYLAELSILTGKSDPELAFTLFLANFSL